MHNFLKKIVEIKQKDLSSLKRGRFLNLLNKKIAIIGEIKLASPTIANLGSEKEIVERAQLYEKAGVDAISIITEKHYFKGRPEFVSQIKKNVKIPILQKDFIIDPYQIYEAKIIGADALLLIAKILNKKTLMEFIRICQDIGLEPIVEISDETDLKKVVETATRIIAVNARDLTTFIVNVDKACELMKKIPGRFIKLGFSGIKTATEIKKYQLAGAKGVLIGTSLMKAKNIFNYINELKKI